MHLTFLSLISLTASMAAAAATLYVDNKCRFDLYLRSNHDDQQTGVLVIPANTINAFNTLIPGSNVQSNAITVSRTRASGDLGPSRLQAVYNTASNGRTYYDLSTIFGDPLRAEGFQLLAGSAGDGVSVVCRPRTTGDCPNTYSPSNPNGVNAVFSQTSNANLILQFCTSTGRPS